MKKFDLQVDNRLFEIQICRVYDTVAIYEVYECVDKKHWWSIGKRRLFGSTVGAKENVKEAIINSIKDHFSHEAICDSFLKQIDEL